MLLTEAKCVTCGGPVEVAKSSGRPFKYCSNQCRANWRHAVRATNPPKVYAITGCSRCGGEYRPVAKHQKYCSIACEYESRRERTKLLRRKTAQPIPCRTCGSIIAHPKAAQKYCGESCRPAKARTKPPRKSYVKTCVTCGGAFSTEVGNKKYCSQDCCPTKYRPTAKCEKQCKRCGESFVGYNHVKFCSRLCARRASKGKNKSSKHRDRCRVYHRRYEYINPQKVFERDKWICGICFAPIDRDTVIPDPLAASLDHRIPLSKGGHHEWNNVRCAHFGCNSLKSDKLDEEINWPAVDHQHQRTS